MSERFVKMPHVHHRINSVRLCVAALAVNLMLSFHVFAHEEAFAERSAFLKKYTECASPYDWFSSDEWILYAFFFDIDQDGRAEALVANPDGQTDRLFTWDYAFLGEDGNVAYARGLDDISRIMCAPTNFFEVDNEGNVPFMVCWPACCEKYVNGERVSASTGAFRIQSLKAGVCSYDCITGGVDMILKNPSFRKLSNVRPVVSKGFDIRYTQQGTGVHGKRAHDIRAIPLDHKRALVKAAELDDAMRARCVAFDADLDGDTDYYLARADPTQSTLTWKLYINEGDRFLPAKETVWQRQNKDRRYGYTALDPVVRALTNDFLLVTSCYKDSKPAVIILGRDADGCYSQSARKYGGSYSEGEILDLHATILHPSFQSIERLRSEMLDATDGLK